MKNLKIFTENIEQEALDQINTLMEQPAFSDCKVRIMPDVHAGAGCVIGFTADLGDKVIPNIVGVDIGCGMLTVNLGKIDIDFEKLDIAIRKRVPCGYNVHEGRIARFSTIQGMYCYRNLKDTRRFELLIIRSNALFKQEHLESHRKAIMEQIKSGVVVLPAYLEAELINVPDDIEVIMEGPNEIQQKDDNQSV